MRVLVVEDDSEKLRHVSLALHKVPNFGDDNIDFAHTAVEAKQKLRDNAYDLLVLDINVPTLNGLQFFEIMIEKGFDTPAIFITEQTF